MPVADATVSVKAGAERWRWFIPNGEIIGTYDAKTDAAGMFTVVIPAADLKKRITAVILTITSRRAPWLHRLPPRLPSATRTSAPVNHMYSLPKLQIQMSTQACHWLLHLRLTMPTAKTKPIGIKWQLLDDDKKQC